MSIRESINNHPGVAKVAATVLFIAAIGAIVLQLRAAGPAGIPNQTQAFFTTDDGATWFADDISKVSGFDHNGKPAYRAYVYRSGDGEPFVGYLERYTPQARAALEQQNQQPAATPPGPRKPNAAPNAATAGREVKKPGEGRWIPAGDPQVSRVLTIRAPDGSNAALAPVLPQ
jgi:hypothetical protein